MTERLFVYGTLRASADHPMGRLLRDHAALIGTGTIRARLYIINDPDTPGDNFYPGAVPCASDAERVEGEVYALHDPETVQAAFDEYEACSPNWPEPHEFILRRVPVTLQSGEEVWARSYLYAWDVTGARHVASGVFDALARDVR
ncbi:gamma-glutamylcyclotransferase family protein [Pseudaestuariivita sp.]|uniref:gamma-glutamylcyclotransferase family protein n=1 Tax=Pseudaestuariivita sp. TaxID=2211669 RepID=UPI004059C019